MLDSPTIQQIASALTRPSPRLATGSKSRILCLKLQELPSAGFKRSSRTASMRAITESFLKFSPRVQYRDPHWIFIDIASTSHLFRGEESLMPSAVSLARDLGFSAQCAVADTPSGAQAFAIAHPNAIIPPGEERERLRNLSLPLLLHLEGVSAWNKPSSIENIIAFFMMLGFKSAGDLSRFTLDSFQERWGESGTLLWKRLNAQDHQVISPLLPTEPLKDYVHMDFPVSLTSLLLHQLEKSLAFLFARLQGRRLIAQKMTFTLHCEYSGTQHKIEIEPNTPSRNQNLFSTLLESRLSEINLENPVREFEVDIDPCPEKSRQLDFFEPRVSDSDKAQSLFSILSQSALRPGLYQIEPSILPERGWQLSSDPSQPLSLIAETHLTYETETAVSPQPCYGDSIMQAPRPTRLLREPAPLSLHELQNLKVLSSAPIERLESDWWEGDGVKRDYYFAISREGQCLWIFQDMHTEEYFLHGYFD